MDVRDKYRVEKLPGWLTAHQAADFLGFEYIYFTRLLSQGKIPRAVYWQRVWCIPDDITEEEFLTLPGREAKKDKLPWETLDHDYPWDRAGS